MCLVFISLLLSWTVAGPVLLGLADSGARQAVPLPRDLAVDEPPCATASVRADQVILPATWCLALTNPGIDLEDYTNHHVPKVHWITVTQPREINALLVENSLIPDPRKSRNLEDLAWLADAEWWLANEFYWPEGRGAGNQTLILEGLLGATGAWLNGREIELIRSEFTQVRADLKNLLLPEGRNRFVLRVTASEGQRISPPNPSGAALFRCGLEGKARIIRQRDIHIEAVGSRVTLATDYTSGTVELDVRVRKRSPGTIKVHGYARLRLPDKPRRLPLYHAWGRPESLNQGENQLRLILDEDNLRLWWPIGAGERHVYPVQVQIRQGPSSILAERRILIGFRSIEWREDGILLVNGRPVSIRATEWTPIDPFHPDPENALTDAISSLIQANLNAVWVRAPGGFESEQFYDICDQAGILVFQEVPTGSPRPDQHRVMNLEKHPSMVAWTRYGAGTGEPGSGHDPLAGLDHARPVLPVSPFGEGPGLHVVHVPAAPHPQTWEDLLKPDERWPTPSLWQPGKVAADQLAAQIPDWGTVENCLDYSVITQSIQATSLRKAIEQTRITAPNSASLITGQLRAPWPGLSPALLDVLNRPSMAFWAVRRSWKPAILSLRRTEKNFEAWIVNTGPEPVSSELTVFDALRPAGDRRSIALVTVPSGTAALVWSSTKESWAEEAFREDDLRVLGAFVGEPMFTANLATVAMPIVRTSDGTRIPDARASQRRDPRVPPSLQASLFCVAPGRVAVPTADLHIITFAKDRGPWRMTIRSFGRKYLRQVRLVLDPPDAAYADDQFFDIVPDSGHLVTIKPLDPRAKVIRVTVSAANAAPVSFGLVK